MNENNIWIQPGTRLHMLVRKNGHWEVWVATDNRSGDSSKWFGTYFEVYSNGLVIQCTRTQTSYNEITIRGPSYD